MPLGHESQAAEVSGDGGVVVIHTQSFLIPPSICHEQC